MLPFKIDSTCFLAMLNSKIQLKNMLLMNAVAAFKEELMKISCMFSRARIAIGYIPGNMNPADSLTKLYKDPIAAINSMIYKSVHKVMGPGQHWSRMWLLHVKMVSSHTWGSQQIF